MFTVLTTTPTVDYVQLVGDVMKNVTDQLPPAVLIGVIGTIAAAVIVPTFIWAIGRKGVKAATKATLGKGASF